jgi:hypothetical protein
MVCIFTSCAGADDINSLLRVLHHFLSGPALAGMTNAFYSGRTSANQRVVSDCLKHLLPLLSRINFTAS